MNKYLLKRNYGSPLSTSFVESGQISWNLFASIKPAPNRPKGIRIHPCSSVVPFLHFHSPPQLRVAMTRRAYIYMDKMSTGCGTTPPQPFFLFPRRQSRPQSTKYYILNTRHFPTSVIYIWSLKSVVWSLFSATKRAGTDIFSTQKCNELSNFTRIFTNFY